MDSGEQQEEEVSARILLRRVLGSELIRSPVTRSVSRTQADSRRRRSSRVRNLPPAESPQSVLRHKLKHKLQQSSSQSPAPPTKRRRSQGRAVKTPAVSSSSLYDEDITPRGLLRGIIQTEAEASLLLSGQPAPPDTDQPLPETSSRLSEGASGLELPDLVTEPLSNLIGGMSRRRPPPTFNISAFERQLDQQSGERAEPEEQNPDETEEPDLSAASKSVLSLTLKTPFVNAQSERAGLRRKAANRRQPSVDAFDEAVQKRLNRNRNQEDTVVQEGRTLGDSDWQKFTLGLSNVTVPDLTTDIVLCNTELYPQPPAATSPLKEQEGGASELHKIHEDVGGAHQNEEIVEDHLYEEVVEGHQRVEEEEDHQEGEVIEDTHDDDEGVEDHQKHSVNKTYETEPQPLRDEEKSQLHLQLEEEEDEEEKKEEEEEEEEEEGKEMDMVSSPEEKDSRVLSPDDIPFAPTQAMTEPLPQEGEGLESGMQEEEEIGWRDSVKEDLQTMELPSQLLERITRRAYRSEGGAIMPGVTARGRVTKSLGAGLHPADREAQSFMGVRSPIGSAEEHSEASPSVSSTLRRSPSVTRQTGAEQDLSNAEQENIVSSSVHQSINPLSPAAEEEELEEEHGEEEEHQEELEEEEHQEELEEEEHQEEEEEELEEEEEELEEEKEENQEEEHQVEEAEHREEAEHGEEVEHREEVEHWEEEGADREEMEVEADQVDEDDDDDDAQSEELSMQTPAFIRQRKQIKTPGALTTPPALKIHNTAVGGVKRGKVKVKRGVGCDVLPKSYVMSVFKHFAKTKVSSDVYPVINDILQKYFDRLADDLEVFSAHARRRTIEVEDVELLMRRQGFVTDSTPLTLLIEKFLPLEYRKLLIPVATSGNKLIPDQRR